MRIALSGVTGSGKTTQLPIIADNFGYRPIKSASSIIEKQYNIKLASEDFNEEIQDEILDTQIMNELSLNKKSSFIADRSILDILTYTIKYYSFIDHNWFNEYYKKLIKSYNYDIVFKFPSNILLNDSKYLENFVIDNLLYSIIKHESESKHFKFIEIPLSIIKMGIEKTSEFIISCIESHELRQHMIRKHKGKK
jgi:hypothetical protein